MSSEQRSSSGVSLTTLLIAGASSAVAALVIPMIWRPGTVFAAAMTPIVVALVSELLKRPVETVGSVRVRRTARGTAILEPPAREPFDPLAPPPAEELEALPRATAAQPVVHRRRRLTARQWRLGLLTGLVAFAVVAVLFTASELIAGDRVSGGGGGGGGGTTFFGGGGGTETSEDRRERRDEEATPTTTPSPDESATPTPTPSATPTPTPSATPPAEDPAAPAPTPAPAEPTPAP